MLYFYAWVTRHDDGGFSAIVEKSTTVYGVVQV